VRLRVANDADPLPDNQRGGDMDWDAPEVERVAFITLQIWCTGDAKSLAELTEETGFTTPTEEELRLGEQYSEAVVEAVCKYIADNWKEGQ